MLMRECVRVRVRVRVWNILATPLLESHVPAQYECATGSRRVYLRYVKATCLPRALRTGGVYSGGCRDPAPPKVPTVHQCVPVHVIGDSPYG